MTTDNSSSNKPSSQPTKQTPKQATNETTKQATPQVTKTATKAAAEQVTDNKQPATEKPANAKPASKPSRAIKAANTPKTAARKTAANKTATNKAAATKTTAAKTTTTKTSATKASASKASTAKTTSKKTSTTKKTTGGKTMTVRKVAIIGGNRIPFARSNGVYAKASNIDMFTAALNGLVERFNLQGMRLGEVAAGAVLKHSRDFNMTRECVLNTALAPETPAYDLQQACGTGLQAAFQVANKIALGQIEVGVAGGVDTTSDAPIAFGDGIRKVFLEINNAKTNIDRLKALTKIDPKDLIDAPANSEPRTGMSMGEHQALTAQEWDITREAQDELAVTSHKKMAKAYDDGFFDDTITPFMGLTRDNNLRPDSNIEKLATLKPVFGKKLANPTMTAANSTPLTDGASCVLLASEAWAKENGKEILAYLTFSETAAVDFVNKKEGLLMAPAYAMPRMLKRAGHKLQDFDFYEIHEAFASQVLSTLKAWEDETFCKERLGLDAPLGSIDRAKLNVNGSSLAAGHPFAATGGRILVNAAKLLNQKGKGKALISICAAGGQGVTAIVEKP